MLIMSAIMNSAKNANVSSCGTVNSTWISGGRVSHLPSGGGE